MSGLELPTTTRIYWINYKNKYVKLLVLHFLPLLNSQLIVEMEPALLFSVGITLVDIYQNIFPICFISFSSLSSFNSIPCRCCSALSRVNIKQKKSLGVKLHLCKMTHIACKLVFCFDVLKNVFQMINLCQTELFLVELFLSSNNEMIVKLLSTEDTQMKQNNTRKQFFTCKHMNH